MLQLHTEEVAPSRREVLVEDAELLTFIFYLFERWRTIAAICVAVLGIVTSVTLLLPKKYTASASILIEPPAGNDPRGSTAVSPVYLESLKTYERFASSDSLFERALDRMDLRAAYAGVPIETVKHRVLEVEKPRDTKVLEVRATLADRTKARDLARYIAEQTVAINHSLDRMSVEELTEGTSAIYEQARKKLNEVIAAKNAFLEKEPVASLDADVAAAADLRARLQRDLSDARAELAAYQGRSASIGSSPDETGSIAGAIAGAKAQIDAYEKQLTALEKTIDAKTNLLERRKQERELLDKQFQMAQAQFETASNRNTEIASSVAFRGERLEIIDTGVLPERPSSPNLPLNLALALLASILGSVLYLAISFTNARRKLLLSYSSASGT